MGIIDVVILAIVQALTEFIPVSSSGHLLAIEKLTSVEGSLALDVMLHFGTLLALVAYFWPKLLEILQDLLSGKSTHLLQSLIITSVPAVLAGFFFEDFLADDARNIGIVIFMLAFIGIIMIFSESFFATNRLKNNLEKLPRKSAFIIGLGQALALIPGTSRSGMTILAGRLQGLSNQHAAEYAFLAGIPVIFGASLKTILDGEARAQITDQPMLVLLGITLAAVVGWFALGTLIRYLSNKGLAVFGWYRLALAAVLLIIVLNQ